MNPTMIEKMAVIDKQLGRRHPLATIYLRKGGKGKMKGK